MIKILAIGNSFSEDATAYLYDMAKCGGIAVKVLNLYIGGCSLEQHWKNASDNVSEYDYQLNGAGVLGPGDSSRPVTKKISIKDALVEDTWDFITLQQVSGYSGIKDSYYPYIKNLHEYVLRYAPNSRQLIHQTWAYETDSTRGCFDLYDRSQLKMYAALKKAYADVAADLKCDIIPCGDVIQALRDTDCFNHAKGKPSLCRDGFHLDFVYGRYAAAAVWYACILKGDIASNDFLPAVTDGSIIPSQIQLIKDTVKGIVTKNKFLYQ